MFEFAGYIILFIVLATFAWGAVSAAPFVPLRRRDIKRLLDLADTKPGELIIDLGCGDGRILLAAAQQYGLRAYGLELAVWPYLVALCRKWFSACRKNIRISLKNFWRVDLSKADIVVCFLTPPVMAKLEIKLRAQLKPGARFITYAFPLPNITPTSISKPLSSDINIYLYKDIVQPVGKVVDI